MAQQELLRKEEPFRAISPLRELGAYEALWERSKASFKWIADLFRDHPGAVPSDFVNPEIAQEAATRVLRRFRERGIDDFGVRVHGAGEYPGRLRDAYHPIELLYYRGWWDLVDAPRTVAVVGTRHPTDEGQRRARKLVRHLVADNFVIVSGLARGIDTIAHSTAMDESGLTIAVIGTPLTEVYPTENAELQNQIARNYLVISQVPVLRHDRQSPKGNKLFFPERNITMSALTDATIIVEAAETSGTLTQARAALDQGRKLFILDSCFRNPALTWPKKFEERGAIRVAEYDDIRRWLQ